MASVESTAGGVLDISLGGEVRRGPSYLTLFKTNIADFPTLFKTEFRFLIPCLRQKLINSIPCLRQKSRKHTLAGRTSPLSPYKGVPPRESTSILKQELTLITNFRK